MKLRNDKKYLFLNYFTFEISQSYVWLSGNLIILLFFKLTMILFGMVSSKCLSQILKAT